MCLAVPGKVVGLHERAGTPMADVDFGGVRKNVCLMYTPEAIIGDYVIVHVGFAIQRLDEESARRTLAEFQHLGMLAEEFGDGFAAAAREAGLPNPGSAARRGEPEGGS
ncbi:HypC/HybG/HupF family hydrogenase formation chaperone [Nocardia carnea]|uniref:HypC/HybG/HupF family hydrogenase formation chaperone n=1 Tax=Nocardia carnea TaxID=37328 RepID=UPI0024584C7D|nr:HypC/HybG/HupF family hydrogenase formation chaperone [Nocardia carnea]